MMFNNNDLYLEAEMFILTCYQELDKPEGEIAKRLKEIQTEITQTGTYQHTFEELEHGARMAWRNNNRCIGRLFWKSLNVIDKRSDATEDEIAESLFQHIELSTNNGNIKPTITVFRQDSQDSNVRIWNHQLIRYAGYKTDEGWIGDPASVDFTKICEDLGWEALRTHFDVLPIVISIDQAAPKLFHIPSHLVKEVAITHPELDWFKDLQMKWYAVPIISEMKLEIGGITYSAAPFNGWYMGTEIGARNLADPDRYNLLPKIGNKLGYDTKRNSTLWKDRALLELNVAVLHSYKNAKVSIVDHHTAAQQFQLFEKQEEKAERTVTGNWAWLIPPVSPATTHIFHKRYPNDIVKPNYFYQQQPY